MNRLIACLISLCVLGCTTTPPQQSEESARIVANFLNDIESLETIEAPNPIEALQAAAEGAADKTIHLSKVNVNSWLLEASDYAHSIIIVGNHTIVRVDDPSDCRESTSWGACMPRAVGFIKKGALVAQDDYCNNIIGRPDDQGRVVYLFK